MAPHCAVPATQDRISMRHHETTKWITTITRWTSWCSMCTSVVPADAPSGTPQSSNRWPLRQAHAGWFSIIHSHPSNEGTSCLQCQFEQKDIKCWRSGRRDGDDITRLLLSRAELAEPEKDNEHSTPSLQDVRQDLTRPGSAAVH